MAKKSRAQATTAMDSVLENDVVLLEEEEEEGNDLSYWEFINRSDASESDTESLLSLENGFVAWYSLTSPQEEMMSPEALAHKKFSDLFANFPDHRDDLGDVDPEFCVGPVFHSGVASNQYRDGVEDGDGDGDGGYDDDDDDVDDVDDGYGLDDELVPWHVCGKLGRQRMRKLGKRVSSKMTNSKRNPYRYVKPGCVYGKHGLGIKA